MQVGDIVFAPIKNRRLWPGKVESIGVVVQVKFFRVKLPLKVPAKEVEPFTIALAQQLQAEAGDKVFACAIKTAEKASQELAEARKTKVVDLQVSGQAQDQGVRPMLNQSKVAGHPVKQEEDNCKQEQEERDNVAPLIAYSNIQEYVMAMDLQLLISDSRKNSLKEYAFLSSEAKQIVTVHTYPKFLLFNSLELLLVLSYSEKNFRQRAYYQKKALTILNSGVVLLDDCVTTRVMKWSQSSFEELRGRECNRTDQQFCNVLSDFRMKMQQKFQNLLDDYTEVSNRAKHLMCFSQLLKI